MEIKIGEEFEFEGVRLKMVEDTGFCDGCCFDIPNVRCCAPLDLSNLCNPEKSLVYKKVGNIEQIKKTIEENKYNAQAEEPKQETPPQTESCKNDILDHKVRLDLLPWVELEELGKVLTAGAEKYGANKWQNLPDGYQRFKGAMLRHLVEVEKGNIIDKDTGCKHIAQVAINALFMLHFKLKEYEANDNKGLHESEVQED